MQNITLPSVEQILSLNFKSPLQTSDEWPDLFSYICDLFLFSLYDLQNLPLSPLIPVTLTLLHSDPLFPTNLAKLQQSVLSLCSHKYP